MADTVLISPETLILMLASERRPVLLDVRWRLGATDSHTEYEAGHLPGAIYVDLASELSGPPDESAGRHPLPSRQAFVATAARWGIEPDKLVVAYDDNGGLAAARAWWLLRWIGHQRVVVLDGGLGAWRQAGGPVTAAETPPPATAERPVGGAGSMPTVDAGDILAGHVDVLLDARAGERFRGNHEPIDPVAGHIPGAFSAPTTDNLGPDGRFLSAERLSERFRRLGVIPGKRVATYCGSGVTAAHQVLAMEAAGIQAALFAPSWSGWIADPDRPVATGDG